jgi:Dyp-type peroxidase family
MTFDPSPGLELDDVQNGVLHPRPLPYVATYVLLRVDDRRAGREMLRRLIPEIASAADPTSPERDAWLGVALTHNGLRALGVAQASLDTFAPEFRQGMAARATVLGDLGESRPSMWEQPFGTADVHVLLSAISPDTERRDDLLGRARDALREMAGVTAIHRQDANLLPDGREPFGFKDGISNPAVEGSGIPATNPQEQPLKAGEFVLGYLDETGDFPPMPQPDVLGRNGTYLAFRKLHQRVAAFREYLHASSSGADEEELLAAKLVGRWRSGAPLALSPERDDPALGADPARNNDFLYHDDDRSGLRCPAGSHIRRANPRDAFKDEIIGMNRLHRIIRRNTSYGPPLPAGVREDDGVDRGTVFIAVGANLGRQFEFVQTQWVNGGVFLGAPDEKDPFVGANDGSGTFTIPRSPVRRRLHGLPRFTVTRGGEFCFVPGLSALRWLSELTS